MGRKKFSADFHLMFRLLKIFLFVGFIGTHVILFQFLGLTVGDIFASLLAFMPTGWAILQIAQACRPVVKALGMWGSVKALGRGYEYMMGVMIFTPVAILAWFPMEAILWILVLVLLDYEFELVNYFNVASFTRNFCFTSMIW